MTSWARRLTPSAAALFNWRLPTLLRRPAGGRSIAPISRACRRKSRRRAMDGCRWRWRRSSSRAGEVQLAQARGRGTVRVGGYAFEATPAQIIRLSNATSAANGAVARVREIDPNWRPRPGVYESAEGAISHQRGIEAEAHARFNELRRDAIPGTSHNWGVNRLPKELYHHGYRFVGPTHAPGNLYRNATTGAEVRVMQRPANDTGPKRLYSKSIKTNITIAIALVVTRNGGPTQRFVTSSAIGGLPKCYLSSVIGFWLSWRRRDLRTSAASSIRYVLCQATPKNCRKLRSNR